MASKSFFLRELVLSREGDSFLVCNLSVLYSANHIPQKQALAGAGRESTLDLCESCVAVGNRWLFQVEHCRARRGDLGEVAFGYGGVALQL